MNKEKTEAHFKEHAPYLNPNYSLKNLVDEIDVPQHLLSSFINQEYGVGFRNFSIVKGLSILWKILINLNGKISHLRLLKMNLALKTGLLL
jgi:hypothetical protein